MPVVPEPRWGSNQPQTGAQPYIRDVATPEAFGMGVAKATEGLGQQIERSSDVLYKHAQNMQADLNEAATNEAVTKYLMGQAELTNNFNQLQGKDRMDALPKYHQSLEELRQKIRNEQNNPMVRKQYDLQTTRQFGYAVSDGARGAATEMRHYVQNAAKARVEAAKAGGAANWGSNEKFDMELEAAENAAADAEGVKGQAPEVIENAKRKVRSEMWERRLNAMADTNAQAARELFDRNKDHLDAGSFARTEQHINRRLIDQGVRRDAFGIQNGMTGGYERWLTRRESSDRADIENKPDAKGRTFVGLYQFGYERLAHLGVFSSNDSWNGTFNIPGFADVKTKEDFKRSPEAQKAVFEIHKRKMDEEIAEMGLDKYIGKDLGGGINLTREGLYAAMHLGGAEGTKRWLEGGRTASDMNRTTVAQYAKEASAIKPMTPDSNRNDLEGWVAQARAVGATANVPEHIRQEYTDRLESEVRSRYNTVKAIDREVKNERLHTVNEWVIQGTPMESPKSIDEAPDNVREAYDNLESLQRKKVIDQLAKNAKADYPKTEENFKTYQEVLGKAQTDRNEFMKINALDLELPREWRQKIVNEQRRMQKETEGNTHLNQVLGYANVRAALASANLSPGQNKTKYEQFVGALKIQLEAHQEETKGKRLNEKEAGELVGQLLRQEPVKGGGLFGMYDTKERLYAIPVPEDYRKKAETVFKARGMAVDEKLMREAWIRSDEFKGMVRQTPRQ